ncbi:MAG: hypothetical protein IKU29_07115, partial [Parabacteroides sp.]|nr:hypothetical protein [Parabacteroides sp.]
MNESINKIFNSSKILKSSAVSKVRSNRDYLISPMIADELNTYRTWDVFPVFNDAYKHENNDPDNPNNKIGALGVRSIFNKSGAVMLGGTNDDIINQSSDWRISNNVPLMDSPAVRGRIRDHSKCTVKDLVLASSNGELGRETYSYSDFMYCKHLGKMSNNYLITLRRFPLPVDDYISAIGVEPEDRKEFSADTTNSIGCLVTWMGTPGNDMSNLLRYSYKMPFKFQTAQWNDMSGTGPDAAGGPLNA